MNYGRRLKIGCFLGLIGGAVVGSKLTNDNISGLAWFAHPVGLIVGLGLAHLSAMMHRDWIPRKARDLTERLAGARGSDASQIPRESLAWSSRLTRLVSWRASGRSGTEMSRCCCTFRRSCSMSTSPTYEHCPAHGAPL